MGWKVTVDGHTWDTDELTLDEACAIEEELGMSWHTMEPINSARHAKAIVPRLMTHREGITLDAARARVGTMPIGELISSVLEAPKKKAAEKGPKAESSAPSESTGESPLSSESNGTT